MINAVILHGKPTSELYYDPKMPSMSNGNWLPWIQAQLLKKDIIAHTPEVPFSFNPQWNVWRKEVERYEIGPETILIGHSCGGGFWIRYLSENSKLKVNKVILVAPWLDLEKLETVDFFDFKLDPNLSDRTSGVTIFNSDNDQANIHETVKYLRKNLKNHAYQEFHNYGHFYFGDMKGPEFPQLLEAAL